MTLVINDIVWGIIQTGGEIALSTVDANQATIAGFRGAIATGATLSMAPNAAVAAGVAAAQAASDEALDQLNVDTNSPTRQIVSESLQVGVDLLTSPLSIASLATSAVSSGAYLVEASGLEGAGQLSTLAQVVSTQSNGNIDLQQTAHRSAGAMVGGGTTAAIHSQSHHGEVSSDLMSSASLSVAFGADIGSIVQPPASPNSQPNDTKTAPTQPPVASESPNQSRAQLQPNNIKIDPTQSPVASESPNQSRVLPYRAQQIVQLGAQASLAAALHGYAEANGDGDHKESISRARGFRVMDTQQQFQENFSQTPSTETVASQVEVALRDLSNLTQTIDNTHRNARIRELHRFDFDSELYPTEPQKCVDTLGAILSTQQNLMRYRHQILSPRLTALDSE